MELLLTIGKMQEKLNCGNDSDNIKKNTEKQNIN